MSNDVSVLSLEDRSDLVHIIGFDYGAEGATRKLDQEEFTEIVDTIHAEFVEAGVLVVDAPVTSDDSEVTVETVDRETFQAAYHPGTEESTREEVA